MPGLQAPAGIPSAHSGGEGSMKKLLLLSLFLPLLLSLGACGAQHQEQAELHIFAAVSMTETMNQIITDYKLSPLM